MTVSATRYDRRKPKSPQDAIAIQNSRSTGGRAIPLYDVDDATVKIIIKYAQC